MVTGPEPAVPPQAITAADSAALGVLDDLVTDLDADMARTGNYDVETLRTALSIAGREVLEAAAPHLEAAARERCAQQLDAAGWQGLAGLLREGAEGCGT